MNARALEKAIRFGERYGVSSEKMAKLMNQLTHISVYSHQRGHAHSLCNELFFALDLTPRANEMREVLYTPRTTNRRGAFYSGSARQSGDTMIIHLTAELAEANCDQCVLIASLIIANTIPIARPTGMRHLKTLLKLT